MVEAAEVVAMVAAGLGFIVFIRWLWELWPFGRHSDGCLSPESDGGLGDA